MPARLLVASLLAWVVVACTSETNDDMLVEDMSMPSGTCSNGVKDPDEAGIDCGGVCSACECLRGTDCRREPKNESERQADPHSRDS